MTRATPAARKGRRRIMWIITAVVVVAAVATATVALWPSSGGPTGAPGQGTKIVASDLSKAAIAARDGDEGSEEHTAAAYLSEQPTAYWLTPEAEPVGAVAQRIAHLAAEAREQSARLAVVVYGLPGRDCGNHSAGGLAPAEYAEWTREIGEALTDAADLAPIVILEPDSLALAPECGNVAARSTQLTDAVDALASESTWIYVDGGHSNWLPTGEMASLIDRVGGRENIRGFVTNVSNFNTTDDEIDYAHALSERLNGMHAIIDTSRNGAGSNGEWCNPQGRLVGDPGGTMGDDVIDTNLWIKPPGESDGTCNGGPAAGAWWPKGAVALTRDVVRD